MQAPGDGRPCPVAMPEAMVWSSFGEQNDPAAWIESRGCACLLTLVPDDRVHGVVHAARTPAYFRSVGHDHQHDARISAGERSLRAAFFLNLAFTGVEIAGGAFTSSLAVLSDAVHDLGDCLVLGAAWYLQGIALRGRTDRYSYGYARFSMLGGWMASIVLIGGSAWMLANAVPRLNTPGSPYTPGMIALAIFGVLMNGLAAWRLRGGSGLSARGVRLHLLEDVLGWAAVLVGGVLIHYTGWTIIDPLLSIAISLYIVWNAVHLLRAGTGILMQARPDGAGEERIAEALRTLPNVRGVHDQHVWSLDGSYTVLTVHLVVDDLAAHAITVKRQARARLSELGIDHATIEMEEENEPCELLDH